jgi:hypothetical protein
MNCQGKRDEEQLARFDGAIADFIQRSQRNFPKSVVL